MLVCVGYPVIVERMNKVNRVVGPEEKSNGAVVFISQCSQDLSRMNAQRIKGGVLEV